MNQIPRPEDSVPREKAKTLARFACEKPAVFGRAYFPAWKAKLTHYCDPPKIYRRTESG